MRQGATRARHVFGTNLKDASAIVFDDPRLTAPRDRLRRDTGEDRLYPEAGDTRLPFPDTARKRRADDRGHRRSRCAGRRPRVPHPHAVRHDRGARLRSRRAARDGRERAERRGAEARRGAAADDQRRDGLARRRRSRSPSRRAPASSSCSSIEGRRAAVAARFAAHAARCLGRDRRDQRRRERRDARCADRLHGRHLGPLSSCT